MLRAVAHDADLAGVAEEQRLTADLARLAPDLFDGRPDLPDGSAEDRFRLFDAMARLLGLVTRVRPLMIVLDDARWADGSSLQLLGHVARTMAQERLLVVVNHRDTEPPHAILVSELRREPVTREVRLRGLSAPAVGRQLAALAGREFADADVARVHARTGGNPFFVTELSHALPNMDTGVTVTVREAIGARLGLLAPAAVRLLRAASIVGREFAVPVVAAMTETPVQDCLAALDEAATAGLTEPASAPGKHQFVHDLIGVAQSGRWGGGNRARRADSRIAGKARGPPRRPRSPARPVGHSAGASGRPGAAAGAGGEDVVPLQATTPPAAAKTRTEARRTPNPLM